MAVITTVRSFSKNPLRFVQVSKKFIDVITLEPRFMQQTLPLTGV